MNTGSTEGKEDRDTDEDENESPVWILWVCGGAQEEFASRELAEEELKAAASKGARGIIYDDIDELKRDLEAWKENH